jgi:hypothetical protein
MLLTTVVACGVAQAQAPAGAAFNPGDYTGVWRMMGGTIFDRSTAEPANAAAGQPGAARSDRDILHEPAGRAPC